MKTDADDIISRLDALAEIAGRDTSDDYMQQSEYIRILQARFELEFVLVKAWPQLRAELLAARKVCEAVERRFEAWTRETDLDLHAALAAWRATREVKT